MTAHDATPSPVQTGPDSFTGYLYDAVGHRVAKGTLPSLTCDPTNLQVTAAYFIGPDGETMTEIDGNGSWVRTEVSAAGQFLATYTPTGLHLPVTDWLGTKRLTLNPNLAFNNGIEETCASFPFGDQLNCTTPIYASPKHFTGKGRDTESGNDYFGARYYTSSMGRWMSPDPLNLTNARLMNPSNTLNKYAYAANNPLKYIDKDGKDITIFYRAPDGLFDTGHIFIGVVNTENGSAAFLNFHPTGNELYGPGTFQNNLQALGADGIDKSYASLTIQTNPGPETQKLVDLINRINNGTSPDYSLFTNNCTTVCEDALHDVGLDFGDLSPQSFWDHAFVKFSPDMQTNPFKAFFPPSAPKHDYGNPRNFGVNYSTLLYNLVFQHPCTDTWDPKTNTLTGCQ